MLLLLAVATPSFAQSEPKITIAFDARSVPTQYVDSGGKVAGIYPGIVRRAFEIIGQPVSIVALPFRRVVDGLVSEKAGGGAVVQTTLRSRYSDFSDPYFTETVSVYSLARRSLRFNSTEDRRQRSIGVISGWAYGEPFDQERESHQFRVESVESDVINFRKLNAGRIDFALATTLSGRSLSELAEFEGIRPAANDLARVDIHLAFNKTSHRRALLSRFNAAIQEMRRSGELSKIIAREEKLGPSTYRRMLH